MSNATARQRILALIAGLLLFSAIAIAQLRITTTTVPVASQYQSYNTILTAAGGTLPYRWSVVSSSGVSLPEGMSLNSVTGLVSATQVNGQGGYAVTLQVADSGSPAPNVAAATINFGVTSDSSYGGCQMFPPDSIYNQRIDLLPVDSEPSHQIPSSQLTRPLHPDFGHGFYPAPGGIPFMRVTKSQPLTNVNLMFSGQIDSNGTYSWPFPAWPNAVIEGTSDGLDASDHHILVLQSSVNNITGPQAGPCILYETYRDVSVPSMYNAVSSTWFVSAGARYVLDSNEIAASTATLDSGAQDSPGIPMVPLLIRYSEVPLGVHHPLRIAFPSPTNGYVWPGTGCCSGSGPPQGLLYRLKTDVNWQAVCPVSLYPQAATVLQALQQYGAYMSDHGSTGFVGGAPDVRWDDEDLACVKRLHVSDLEVVDNSALEVSAISGQTKPHVVPGELPNGTVGTAYSATFSAVGGNPASRQWSVSAGALPPGLLLAFSTGTISGTITSSTRSPYNFGITATDTSSGYAAQTQPFSITVTGGSPGKITSTTSTTSNGTYGVGAKVVITVLFSESVTVTGTPQLTLNSGGTANYGSGTGSNTLAFMYTVGAGQNNAHLDYTSTSALTLNGGTIKDSALNAITLTLVSPGAPGSLGANTNIAIDTNNKAPDVTAQFTVTSGIITFNRGTQRYSQTVAMTNNGADLIFVALALDNLSAGSTLLTPSGTTGVTSPAGSPYFEAGSITKGRAVNIVIQFTRTGTGAIAYTPRVLGAGPR